MWFWLAGLTSKISFGAPSPETAAEELVVFGDPYARWDGTRFLVRSEVAFPPGLALSDGEGTPWAVDRWQISLVLRCEKGEIQLWDGIEVSCVIEDLGLVVQSEPLRPREHEARSRLLDRIDALLTGASVQLQVARGGAVPNLDLEGLPDGRLARRRAQESMREILALPLAGFSLPLPEGSPERWFERHSELLDLPSETASRGSSEIVHVRSPHEGGWRIDSAGEGSTALPLTGSIAGETLFSMTAKSQAWLRRSDGVMTARRWSVEGRPSPSSPVIDPCEIEGEIRLLGPSEAPQTSPTAIAAL